MLLNSWLKPARVFVWFGYTSPVSPGWEWRRPRTWTSARLRSASRASACSGLTGLARARLTGTCGRSAGRLGSPGGALEALAVCRAQEQRSGCKFGCDCHTSTARLGSVCHFWAPVRHRIVSPPYESCVGMATLLAGSSQISYGESHEINCVDALFPGGGRRHRLRWRTEGLEGIPVRLSRDGSQSVSPERVRLRVLVAGRKLGRGLLHFWVVSRRWPSSSRWNRGSNDCGPEGLGLNAEPVNALTGPGRTMRHSPRRRPRSSAQR